jgi:hypothetical protein
MPWCQYGDAEFGQLRQKVFYIVRHDCVRKSVDSSFQYEFVVWISELWAQPSVEADSNGPSDEVVEEVRYLL